MPQKRIARRRERRGTARADARLSMMLKGPRDDGHPTQVAMESQNISASGVYCLSPHYLAPLSKINLAIVLPRLPGGRGPKDVLNCEGIVVRCDAGPRKSERLFQLACMFTGLDARRRQRIEEFVTWRNLQALRAAAGERVKRATTQVRTAARRATAAARAGLKRARAARPASATRKAASRRDTVH